LKDIGIYRCQRRSGGRDTNTDATIQAISANARCCARQGNRWLQCGRDRTVIEENGSIDYDESGEGPTIVLVPGSCSTGVAWRTVVSRWNTDFRCVTTSLLGYGGTAERRTPLDVDISHEAEMLEAVIQRAACPVHLVGHSFGGLTALAVAIRNKAPLLSLSILEAPAVELLRHMGEHRHYGTFRRMSDAYFDAFYAGESAAIEQMIDFYGGPGTFAGWPQRVRDYAVQTTAVNILDWASAYGFQLTPASLANIVVPTLVLWGEASPPAIRRANELVAQCTKATAVTIPEAAHFMISTHADAVARVLAQHVLVKHKARAVIGDTLATEWRC
jgi:pimeloyl-ACP methyl ester carboxylesterase